MIAVLLLIFASCFVHCGQARELEQESSQPPPTRFIISRNLVTGEHFVQNLTVINEPTPVRRVRLMFSTTKAASADGLIDVFHMRLRWLDPDFWNDNFTETGRSYKILCEIEDEQTSQVRTFLALTVEAVFNGYDEKYVFPRMSLVARCMIRARNGAGLDSEWTLSPSVSLSELMKPLPSFSEDERRFDNPRHQYRRRFLNRFGAV